MGPASTERSRKRLSTGHAVSLPLDLEFTLGGVVVPARRSRLEAILPSELATLSLAPGVGCVALIGIQYHRVGDRSGLEPYDEFAVIVPAVRGGAARLPLARVVGGEVGGYVHWLPVTTDPSVALGREIWGHPKERADITVTDGPSGLRCVVGTEKTGGDRVRLEVPRPRARVGSGERDRTLWSYTTKGGDPLRTRADVRGDVAVGTPVGATLELDPDLRADLGCWSRPLARVYGSRVRARLHAGTWIDDA